MSTDPIADLLTCIRNAIRAGQNQTKVPYSKLKKEVVRILQDKNYITGFEVVEDAGKATLLINLNPKNKDLNLIRVSKPGRRVYRKNKDIYPILNGLGIAILSTPEGLMTDREARQKHLGGEVICQIW